MGIFEDFIHSPYFESTERGYTSPTRADAIGDKGGETLHGVTREWNPTFEGWERVDQLRREGASSKEIAEDPELWRMIVPYIKEHYWDKYHIGDLPESHQTLVFDGVFHRDPRTHIRDYQRAIGMPEEEVDGYIGEDTIDQANDIKDLRPVITTLATFREQKQNAGKLAKGVINRIHKHKRYELTKWEHSQEEKENVMAKTGMFGLPSMSTLSRVAKSAELPAALLIGGGALGRQQAGNPAGIMETVLPFLQGQMTLAALRGDKGSPNPTREKTGATADPPASVSPPSTTPGGIPHKRPVGFRKAFRNR